MKYLYTFILGFLVFVTFNINAQGTQYLQEISSFEVPSNIDGAIQSLIVYKNHLFMVARNSQLHIINISNPQKQAIFKFVDEKNAKHGNYYNDRGKVLGGIETCVNQMRIYKGYLYLCDSWNNCVTIIDPSNPLKPKVIGTITSSRWYGGNRQPVDIDFSGKYAYVVAGDAGLEVFDISDPSFTRNVSKLDLRNSSNTVNIYKDYAFVRNTDGIYFIDIKQPASPKKIKTLDFGMKGVSSLFIYDDYLMVKPSVRNTIKQISLFNLKNLSSVGPTKISAFDNESGANGYTRYKNLLIVGCVVGFDCAFQIYDIQNSSSIKLLSVEGKRRFEFSTIEGNKLTVKTWSDDYKPIIITYLINNK